MPIVPITKRDLSGPAPVFRTTAGVTQQAFGVDIGLGSIGNALDAVSDILSKIDDDNQLANAKSLAKKMDVDYQDQRRTILFDPDTGWYSLSAAEKAGTSPQVFQQLRNLHEGFIAGSDNKDANTFFDAATQQSLMNDGNVLYKADIDANRQVTEDRSLARSNAAKITAAREYHNSDTLNLTLAIVATEAIDRAEADGFAIDSLTALNSVVAEQSDLMKGVITVASRDDLPMAQKIFLTHAGLLSPNDYVEVSRTLVAAETAAQSAFEKEERDAAAAVKARHEVAYGQALTEAVDGNLTNDVMVELERSDAINAAQFNSLVKFNTAQYIDPKDHLDSSIYTRALIGVYIGNITIAQIQNLKEQVTQVQMKDLVDTFYSEERRGGIFARADVKQELESITRVVGGELGLIAKITGNDAFRLDEAIQEFRKRVPLMNQTGETLQEIGDDIKRKWGPLAMDNPFTALGKLPNPLTWKGLMAGSRDDMVERWNKARNELLRIKLTIDPMVFKDEMDLLNKIKDQIQLMPDTPTGDN